MTVLHVKNFAQIEDAEISFGDLTVLVGPQATGKSLVLQWLKMALDSAEVVRALKEAGQDVKSESNLVDLVFGEGMSAAWRHGRTSVTFDGKVVSLTGKGRKASRTGEGRLFYIPAHRALLLAEGWPAPFLRLNADTPVVARLFSQSLYQRFSGRQASALFPVERILKEQYRMLIDAAVFHGGRVELDKQGLQYRLRLRFGDDTKLPFMTWTSGQREFTPLLLGLYRVLPPRKLKKQPDIDWVVIEEPEMGLHPQAIAVLMLLVLDLLWRGYRVVLSTHSPLVLDVVWAVREIAANGGRWDLLGKAFGLQKMGQLKAVLENALQSDYKVHHLGVQPGGRVRARDISGLDPASSEDSEANWGGLTGFSSNFGEAVRTSVNESGSV